MPLAPGTRIGSYEITSPIGAGGMGEVFRARDLRLGRDVALKVLPDSLADDPERRARFEREARALAALNHPNIAQIYEMTPGVLSIVMELVEGQSLDELIRDAGPLPIEQAVPIAREIADALEAAHASGIIHRDLKPANIRITAAGTAKVLDFGLAKALDPVRQADIANSPTFTGHVAHSPAGDAARRDPRDRRLHGAGAGTREGRRPAGGHLGDRRRALRDVDRPRAFDGAEVTDVLAAILKTDPDWSQLPADVPPSIRRLLRRCLEKHPGRRLSAIADARLELDERDPQPVPAAPLADAKPPARRRSWLALVWPAAAASIATAVMMIALRPAPDPLAAAGVMRPRPCRPGVSSAPSNVRSSLMERWSVRRCHLVEEVIEGSGRAFEVGGFQRLAPGRRRDTPQTTFPPGGVKPTNACACSSPTAITFCMRPSRATTASSTSLQAR